MQADETKKQRVIPKNQVNFNSFIPFALTLGSFKYNEVFSEKRKNIVKDFV